MRKPIPLCLVALPNLVQSHNIKFGPFWTTSTEYFLLFFFYHLHIHSEDTIQAPYYDIFHIRFFLFCFVLIPWKYWERSKSQHFFCLTQMAHFSLLQITFFLSRTLNPYTFSCTAMGGFWVRCYTDFPLCLILTKSSDELIFLWLTLPNLYKDVIPYEWYLWFCEWNSEESRHDSPAPCLSAVAQRGLMCRNRLFQGKRMYSKTCCNSSVALAEHSSLLSFFSLSALAMGVHLKE